MAINTAPAVLVPTRFFLPFAIIKSFRCFYSFLSQRSLAEVSKLHIPFTILKSNQKQPFVTAVFINFNLSNNFRPFFRHSIRFLIIRNGTRQSVESVLSMSTSFHTRLQCWILSLLFVFVWFLSTRRLANSTFIRSQTCSQPSRFAGRSDPTAGHHSLFGVGSSVELFDNRTIISHRENVRQSAFTDFGEFSFHARIFFVFIFIANSVV